MFATHPSSNRKECTSSHAKFQYLLKDKHQKEMDLKHHSLSNFKVLSVPYPKCVAFLSHIWMCLIYFIFIIFLFFMKVSYTRLTDKVYSYIKEDKYTNYALNNFTSFFLFIFHDLVESGTELEVDTIIKGWETHKNTTPNRINALHTSLKVLSKHHYT